MFSPPTDINQLIPPTDMIHAQTVPPYSVRPAKYVYRHPGDFHPGRIHMQERVRLLNLRLSIVTFTGNDAGQIDKIFKERKNGGERESEAPNEN